MFRRITQNSQWATKTWTNCLYICLFIFLASSTGRFPIYFLNRIYWVTDSENDPLLSTCKYIIAYLKRFYCRSESVITFITMSRSTQQNTWMQDEGVKHDTYASNGNKNSNHRQGKAEELKAFLESTSLLGARFLYDSNVFRRIFWTVILLTSLSYCIYQVFVSISAFHRRPFVATVVVSKRTETKLGFPAVSLCNLNAFITRRFRDLYNGSSNGPFIERYIKDISLMATKSEEILTEEFKSRNPGRFYRFQTADQKLVVKGVTSHQIAEILLPSKSKFHSCSLNGIPCTEKKLHLSHKFSVWAMLHF